jgi:Trp operon repressor
MMHEERMQGMQDIVDDALAAYKEKMKKTIMEYNFSQDISEDVRIKLELIKELGLP